MGFESAITNPGGQVCHEIGEAMTREDGNRNGGRMDGAD